MEYIRNFWLNLKHTMPAYPKLVALDLEYVFNLFNPLKTENAYSQTLWDMDIGSSLEGELHSVS